MKSQHATVGHPNVSVSYFRAELSKLGSTLVMSVFDIAATQINQNDLTESKERCQSKAVLLSVLSKIICNISTAIKKTLHCKQYQLEV